VRFSFRHFAFIGDESQWAAEASECASEQGKFWDYYDKIFEEQAGENVGAYSKDNLKLFAGDLGLDRGQFDQCLDSGKYAEKVRQETVLGREAGVRSTPALFVNGQLIEGGANYEILKSAVEAELTK
jgi:protein-disulfide isomerase